MAETNWTEEQQRVIETQGRDLLVSAAAGSGKTAVLVERIIRKILSEDHPLDVDRLLVVTFTNAAAREMKEKIRKAIQTAAEKYPENAHLQRQKILIHHAQITTIDSFCTYILRNHFDAIGLDPSFRIGDTTETDLMEQEVLDDIFEKHYDRDKEEGDPDFIQLIRLYGSRNRDDSVKEIVRTMYHTALSFPDIEDKIHEFAAPYAATTEEEILSSGWMQKYLRQLQSEISDIYQEAVRLEQDLDGREEFSPYFLTVTEDVNLLHDLVLNYGTPVSEETDPEPDPETDLKAGEPSSHSGNDKAGDNNEGPILSQEKYNALLKDLTELKFPTLKRLKPKSDADPAEQEAFKKRREKYKDAFKKIQKRMGGASLSDLLQVFSELRPIVSELTQLTLELHQAFREEKRKNNILDFSDLEHDALEILTKKETGEDGIVRRVPQPVALEFQKQFQEVMIDEYQDSNDVQEELLLSISGENEGMRRYFMVGDVKQSIYRFRQARPEIFMEKYETFSRDLTADRVCINLTRNFRSRKNVLDFTNTLFEKLMKKDVGGVDYDEAARLNLGADYPEPENPVFRPEILLGIPENLPLPETDIRDGEDYEAEMIAARVQKLLQEEVVTNMETRTLRRAEPGDIVILLRKMDTLSRKITDALGRHGIPAQVVTSTGYFESPEVESVLSFLYLIDNPLQDIPMASVLHTMFDVSNDELTEIRSAYPEFSFAEAVLQYGQDHAEETENRVVCFLRLLEGLRRDARRLPLSDLIQKVLDETGFLTRCSALPGGRQRQANLEKMIDLAAAYEQGRGHSIFSFILYIRKMRKYNVSMETAGTSEGQTNAVSLMTIHKSKGLEFPIVILAGTGKQLNKSDYSRGPLFHPEEGMAIPFVHFQKNYKTRRKYLYIEALSSLIKADAQGEELRVLYVALTRAKEKLILTGIQMPGKKGGLEITEPKESISFHDRSDAARYLDWILPARPVEDGSYLFHLVKPEDLELSDAEETDRREEGRDRLQELTGMAEPDLIKEIDERTHYIYPESPLDRYKVKYSVSELKHDSLEEQRLDRENEDPEEPVVYLFPTKDASEMEEEPENCWEDFRDGQDVPESALRGTAMHRFMEVFDFGRKGEPGGKIQTLEDLKTARDELLATGRMTLEEGQRLDLKDLLGFFQSDLYAPIAEAAADGRLYRETPFVLGVHPEDLNQPGQLLRKTHMDGGTVDPHQQSVEKDSAWDTDMYINSGKEFSQKEENREDQMVLVQGTIDAYFLREDDIVLVDYKTDHVSNAEVLKQRYERQVEWYALALERMYHLPVREAYLYSFALGRPISIFPVESSDGM